MCPDGALCDACNVRPEWPGEHRCWGLGSGCTCQSPLCRMARKEVTLEELLAEDARQGADHA